MIILGIESSCDETAAAVLEQNEKGIHILSNIVSSSLELHAKYGGVIPEQAAREQLRLIIPVIKEALRLASLAQGSSIEPDAIAVTYGPGLIGSLLVGVETAKVLATIWQKPLIPINHLIGHFYANWIARGDGKRGAPLSARNEVRTSNGAASRQDPEQETPSFPCIGLLVSGGHTDLVLFKDHGKYQYLGGTRDDAAGECFDKCARVLGFAYPGGPKISRLASEGKTTINFPRPMISSKDFDFSFSGLKTAFVNIVGEKFKLDKGSFDPKTQEWSQKSLEEQLSQNELKEIKNICASLEQTIVDVLVTKTIKAAQKYKVEQIIVAGGVAANQKLVNSLQLIVDSLNPKIQLHIPPPKLCTDNGAMIAAAGFFENKRIDPQDLQADPNLSLN